MWASWFSCNESSCQLFPSRSPGATAANTYSHTDLTEYLKLYSFSIYGDTKAVSAGKQLVKCVVGNTSEIPKNMCELHCIYTLYTEQLNKDLILGIYIG